MRSKKISRAIWISVLSGFLKVSALSLSVALVEESEHIRFTHIMFVPGSAFVRFPCSEDRCGASVGPFLPSALPVFSGLEE